MRQLIKAVFIVLSIAYPFIVYWGLQHYQAAKLLPLLLVLLALRWLTVHRSAERRILIAILVSVLIIAVTWGHQLGLKFYPVMVNLGFLILFAGSLIYPPSFVERLARIREPDLSPEGVAYTLKVTRSYLHSTGRVITARFAKLEKRVTSFLGRIFTRFWRCAFRSTSLRRAPRRGLLASSVHLATSSPAVPFESR